MLPRLMLHWFWDTYDALGRLVVLNLMLFTVFLAFAFLVIAPAADVVAWLLAHNPALGTAVGLLVLTLAATLILTIWMPGLLYFSWQVSQDKEARLADFFVGLRRRGGRFMRLTLLASFLLGIIAVNMAFYARSDVFGGGLRLAGAALAGLCFWLEIVVLGVYVNAMPLAVRTDKSMKDLLKLGLYVTLRYPFQTYGALIFLALLWLLSVVLLKTAPLWLLGLAATATYINSMHDVVVWWEEKKEEEARKANENAGMGETKPPTSWKQIRADEEAANKPKDRYQRTLRDILKPWE